MTTKWEYYFTHGKANEQIKPESMNKLGAEGWELVSFETLPYGIQMVFKRPLPTPFKNDEWIEWIPLPGSGGPNIPCDAKVTIKRRDGSIGNDRRDYYRWYHIGNVGDIVAYRVAS